MRQRFVVIVLLVILLVVAWVSAEPRGPAINPDPNHTHADFAIWTGGKEMEFSDPAFFSESGSLTGIGQIDGLHQYIHIHEVDTHVIHRHKPGMTFGQFLEAGLALSITKNGTGSCLKSIRLAAKSLRCFSGNLRMFVNGREVPPDSNYVFADLDKILLTDAVSNAEADTELKQMTDDACMYSQTCPERGKPPPEDCVADPTVPCRG